MFPCLLLLFSVCVICSTYQPLYVNFNDVNNTWGFNLRITNADAIPGIADDVLKSCGLIISSTSLPSCGWAGNGISGCIGFVAEYSVYKMGLVCRQSDCNVAEIAMNHICERYFYNTPFGIFTIVLCGLVGLLLIALPIYCAVKIKCCHASQQDEDL